MAFLAASCGSREVIPIEVETAARVSPVLKIECEDAVIVPKRDLKKSEIIEGWNTDRTYLRVCKARHKALVGQVELLEEGAIQ